MGRREKRIEFCEMEKRQAKSTIKASLAFPSLAGARTDAKYSPAAVAFNSSRLARGLTVIHALIMVPAPLFRQEEFIPAFLDRRNLPW